MQTRIESSEFTRSQASSMIRSISLESALRRSGRFMVTVRTWPSCSTRQSVMAVMLATNENVF